MRGFLFRCCGKSVHPVLKGTGPEDIVDRREFMKFGGVAAIELSAAKLLMSEAQQPGMPGMQASSGAPENSKAD